MKLNLKAAVIVALWVPMVLAPISCQAPPLSEEQQARAQIQEDQIARKDAEIAALQKTVAQSGEDLAEASFHLEQAKTDLQAALLAGDMARIEAAEEKLEGASRAVADSNSVIEQSLVAMSAAVDAHNESRVALQAIHEENVNAYMVPIKAIWDMLPVPEPIKSGGELLTAVAPLLLFSRPRELAWDAVKNTGNFKLIEAAKDIAKISGLFHTSSDPLVVMRNSAAAARKQGNHALADRILAKADDLEMELMSSTPPPPKTFTGEVS